MHSYKIMFNMKLAFQEHSRKQTALLMATFTVSLNCHTNSVFLHSQKWPAPVITDTFFVSWGCPLMSASTFITITIIIFLIIFFKTTVDIFIL